MAARRLSGAAAPAPLARPTTPRGTAARARRGRCSLLKIVAAAVLTAALLMTAAAHYAVLRPRPPPAPVVPPVVPAPVVPPVVRHPPAAGTPSRRQPRTTVAANAGCANTYGASPSAVADSRGGVCAPDGLDEDGCCCQASGNPCDRCAASSCCDTYENCVACCVRPRNAEQRRLVRKHAVHAVLKEAADDFELCRFRCLTNSGSTLHQNSYRSATERHCFGSVRPPLDPRTVSYTHLTLPTKA